ncbi:Anaerobic nitric oxide reductase flavorubredoxin [Paraburkholderia sediminicola]|jgi:rubredoxin|uniref:Rubredoxin n=2 Tax=Paraburkholderia TaxID=1822464 RepID=A0A6J5BZT6_9BURK|nr:rubredoxin [Paraburkholderia sp. WS6]CAB3721249.1 Anaerobic nitric oxide reductase flavorubredoxin [Paraburkholderia sediminicola]CAE6707810.1 Anaerobic nitric oxide reductase flavorubredoxin [Paraburkholderia nemoris]CAE6755426.1 Anaerobic nitric oxide reductase flavorubredoxin [Paraburkholderia nemoris]
MHRTKEEYVVSEVIELIEYKSWVCLICGWIYNEEEGLPEEGIAPGTRFAAIPDDWRCPLCDVGKAEFAVVEF